MRTKEEISLAAGTTSVNEHRTFLGKWGPSFCTFSQVQRWIPATIVSQNQELCRCCCHARFLRAKIHCFDQKHQKQFSCSKVNISVQRHILFISFHCNPSRSMSRMSRMRLKWRCLLADIKSRFRSLQVPDPARHCETHKLPVAHGRTAPTVWTWRSVQSRQELRWVEAIEAAQPNDSIDKEMGYG